MDGMAAIGAAAEVSPPGTMQRCFHCGEPAGHAPRHFTVIDGVNQPMCCAGCEAVARTIVANGLGEYYRRRRALPDCPAQAVPDELRRYDLPAIQASLVETGDRHDEKEVSLLL